MCVYVCVCVCMCVCVCVYIYKAYLQLNTGPDGTVALSLANGLVGTGFTP